MTSLKALRSVLMCGVTAIVMAAPAFAQTKSFDLPAQPAVNSIPMFAKQAGIQIVAPASQLSGINTQPIHGEIDRKQALAKLLEGTPLTVSSDDGSVVILQIADKPKPAITAPARMKPEAAAAPQERSVDEVVISGQRSGDRAAADQIAAAGTTSVLTSEMMNSAPDNNVAEALARLPGIAFTPTAEASSPSQGNHFGLDAAGRGVGEFVSVRGMNPEFNVNLINGVNVAEGMPYGREVELSLLPPIGIDKIVVSKTSTPDMDGDAIGGTFDFRSHSGLDYDKPLMRIFTQGTLDGRALDYKQDAGGGMGQVELADRFGANNQFAVYANGYYGKRNFVSSEQDYQVGQWEFARSVGNQGSNPPGIHADQNLLLTSVNAQFTRGTQERYGGTLNFDWAGETTDLHWRNSIALSNIRQEVYQKALQADGYSAALQQPDGTYLNAESNADEHYWFETAPEFSELVTNQLGGTSTFDRLRLDYDASYSWAQNSAPDHAEVSYQTQGLDAPFNLTYKNKYPIPTLTAGQLAYFNNSSNYSVSPGSGEFTDSFSDEWKVGAHLDASYTIDQGLLQSISAGVKMVNSHRFSYSRDFSNLDPFAAGSSLTGNSYADGAVTSIIPGVYDYQAPLLNGDAFTKYLRGLAAEVAQTPDQINGNTMKATETVYAGYAMANLIWGDWQVLPGIRFEHARIDNTFWDSVSPGAGTSHWASNDTNYDEALPSVHVNYRPDADDVYRAALWTSYVRPAFYQLGGGTQTSLNNDGSISITEGNPNLKSTEAVNYDLSGEWRFDGGTHAMLGLYYKALTHYMYDRGNSFHASTVAATGVQSISQPVNGGSAHLYGTEITVDQALGALMPGVLDRFSVAGNLTLQRSAAHLNDSGIEATSPMQGAPDLLFNASLTYANDGFSGALSYRYSGDSLINYRFGTFGGNELSEWLHPTQQLDLSLGYAFAAGVQVTFAAQNMMDDYSYYRTIGRHNPAIPQIVEPGRNFILTCVYTY